MNAVRDPLARHLFVAVALKLAVLSALWWAFVRDEQVGVDVDRAAAHLGAVLVDRPVSSSSNGATP